MLTSSYTYDPLGRLTSVYQDNGARTVYQYDELGNRIATSEVPACCGPMFNIIEKSGDFSAIDGAGSFYKISADAIVTMPASPADGGVYKFKVTGGTADFVFDGTETINHANGVSDQNLSLGTKSGVIELVAVVSGWDET